MDNKILVQHELKHTWDDAINKLGEKKPSNNGHTSIFLYPFQFVLKKKNKYFSDSLKSNHWIAQNENKSDFHNISKITGYLKESLFQNKNMIFSKKINLDYELWIDGKLGTNFHITEVEALFFDNDIFIFSIFTSSNDNIHNISSKLNREMRNPVCLYFDSKNNRFLSFDHMLENVEELKQQYCIEHNIAIISFKEYIKMILSSDNTIDLNEVESGKSKYAKHITSIHTEISNELEQKLLYSYPELQHDTDVVLNILNICTNNLSISNDFIFSNKKFEQDLDYTRSCIKNYSIRLWSLWGGIASLNSLSFLSVNDGGRSIVHQCNNEIYIIYLINIYIKIKLQIIDKNIINENFMQINKSRSNLENLFELKAKYFSEEIADSFQPILIDKKIKSALGVDSLLKNIEENIVKTNDIVKENNSTVYAIVAAFYIIINDVVPIFTDSKTIKTLLFILGVIGALLLWKRRNQIGKAFDFFLK